MADRWEGSICTLTGEVLHSIPKVCSDTNLECKKSAEAVVVKTVFEKKLERRAEQFYRYENLDWERNKTAGIERESGYRLYEKERTNKHVSRETYVSNSRFEESRASN